MSATQPSSYRLIRILAVIAAISLAARFVPQPRTIDDAFITFRYSRNLVEGYGFVYNTGVRTMGTTTPLFTLAMAGIGLVTGSEDYPWFALIVNALADSITVVLLGLLAYRVTRSPIVAVILGGLWAVSPMSVTFAVGGMETSVVILWMVAAILCYITGHERWMAVFAALSVLTRIDTLIWVGPLLLHQWYTYWRAHRDSRLLERVPWQNWVIFAALLLPWYVFSWSYFGTVLSNSLRAKTLAYHIGEFEALVRLLQHIATPFLEQEAFGTPGIVIGIVLYPTLAGIGTLYAVKRESRLLPFLLYPWLYVAVFSIMNPLIFRWYLAPPLPGYFLAILVGVWALAESIIRQPRGRLVTIGVVGIIFLALSLNAWALHPDHEPDRPAPKMAWHQIELYYQRMSERLRNDYGTTEDTLVAVGDIGAVGYYTRARILDTVGLVTPEILDYYPVDEAKYEEDQNYLVPPAIILDYQPDYIVLMEIFLHQGLADTPAFEEQYQTIDFIPTDFYGEGMILYQRRDLAGE